MAWVNTNAVQSTLFVMHLISANEVFVLFSSVF